VPTLQAASDAQMSPHSPGVRDCRCMVATLSQSRLTMRGRIVKTG
jgi:hypothetical protein